MSEATGSPYGHAARGLGVAILVLLAVASMLITAVAWDADFAGLRAEMAGRSAPPR